MLFDAELAQRVQCTTAGDLVTLSVQPADDDAVTIDALSMVLPAHAAACKGRTVRIDLKRPVAKARDFCIEFAKKHGAARIELAGGSEPQVLWPKLITAAPSGGELLLRLQANGRSRAAVLAAFAQEAPEHAAAAKGKVLVVDWPAGTAIDAETEAALLAAVTATGAKGLVATIGGDQREPFAPAPVQFRTDGELRVVRVDSEAGQTRRTAARVRSSFAAAPEGPARQGGAGPDRRQRRAVAHAVAQPVRRDRGPPVQPASSSRSPAPPTCCCRRC